MAQDYPKPSNPPKSLYQKFSGGLFHLIYLLKAVSFPKWTSGVIAWCGSEQTLISWFLWGSHAGEKWTGLNWGFFSCCTSACQPMSHELVKCWGDVVAGAAFETAFSHAQGWQKQLGNCLCAEPQACTWVSCTPFPPGACTWVSYTPFPPGEEQ